MLRKVEKKRPREAITHSRGGNCTAAAAAHRRRRIFRFISREMNIVGSRHHRTQSGPQS